MISDRFSFSAGFVDGVASGVGVGIGADFGARLPDWAIVVMAQIEIAQTVVNAATPKQETLCRPR